jgi:23S rRNA (uracil1939-C5)-methyltransferase
MSSAHALCRHFGACGGCTYQDMPPARYRAFKRQRVVDALAREALADIEVAEVAEIAPATRRRATFKAEKTNGRTILGFHAAQSHTIVDMHECQVLSPALIRLVPGLRDMMASRLKEGEKAELYVVEADNGFDVSLRGLAVDAQASAWAADWARRLGLARMTAGHDLLAQLAQPAVTFGRVSVPLPAGAFLQPTREGETLLAEHVLAALRRSRRIADLFCGIGTFALRAAEFARVLAVDADGPALEALAAGARATQRLKPIEIRLRDLTRRPLGTSELDLLDAVILDPPRAGAARQCEELARARMATIVYISCNPASFARDTRKLVAGGWRTASVIPVDQFVWSSHIELVASFSRD